MKLFKKGDLIGSLQLVTIDHCISKKSKIFWTTKKVLMLVDKQGRVLCTAQFRSNAFKKAEKFLVDLNWSVTE